MRARRWRRLIRPFKCGLVTLVGAMLLAGCAAGAPSVASNPTATAHATEAAVLPPVVTATATAEESASVEPTRPPSPKAAATRTKTPKPAKPTRTPTEGPTPRPAPPPADDSGLSRVFDHSESGRREVALTFDAGDDRGYAEEILDTLRDFGVRASFGLTGHWAKENPDLVERMVDEGHMLFNHTYSHRSFTGFSTSEGEAVLSTEDRQQELLDTEEIVRDLTGYELAPYFRPPYGDYDAAVLSEIAEIGYTITLMYNCDSLGWNGASVDDIVARCGDAATPGDIILLHVGAATLDAEALPRLIETLQAMDLAFVTAEELLQD
ncbi:MAG: peptidoglycan-N-acetylglucosamine deacetylase [Thermomicrobiales bacterium]|nr:peptidoglycan-N-acetylglucosamine deacetylase [Thermomicrobiales bacterium]